jgi:hypothetical protein
MAMEASHIANRSFLIPLQSGTMIKERRTSSIYVGMTSSGLGTPSREQQPLIGA